MPNWAYTCYVAVGERKQLEKLHATMAELENMEQPLHENGFGKRWLGNLVIKLGGDCQKVYCRGSWDDLNIDSANLTFSVESAWSEAYEVRHFIEEKFPDIKLYFQCEESGCGVYQTNDETGQYFPEKYYLWVEDDETKYFDDIESLIKDVEAITGTENLENIEQCREALEEYSLNNSDLGYTLEQFEVIVD